MAIQLSCPACRDRVSAEEAERGSLVKCGTCWADVPVPKAEAAPAPLPVAKAIPLPPKPATATSTALPVQPVVAKAVPLPATAAAPAPAAKAMPASAKPAKPKSRFGERDDRDDDFDDDDRPERSKRAKSKKSGGGGAMIAFIAIGVVVALGAIGLVVALLMNGDTETAEGTSPATTGIVSPPSLNTNPPLATKPRETKPGDFNPNPNPNPELQPKLANIQGWKSVKTNVYKVEMPAHGFADGPAGFEYALKKFSGNVNMGNDESQRYKAAAYEIDSPDALTVQSEAMIAACLGEDESAFARAKADRLLTGGHSGAMFIGTSKTGDELTVMAVDTASKGLIFRFSNPARDPDAKRYRDAFFASVTILVDAVAGHGGGPGQQIDPKKAKPIVTAWKPMENKAGFVAAAPPGVKKEKHMLRFEFNQGPVLGGQKFTTDDPEVAYLVYYHDFPDGQEMDFKKVMDAICREHHAFSVNGVEDIKVDGKSGKKWELKNFFGGLTEGVSVQVGYRLFTFFVMSKNGLYKETDPTLEDRQAKFLSSIKLPFDPKKSGEDDAAWVQLAKTAGFGVLVPKQLGTTTAHEAGFFERVPGKQYKVETDGLIYEAFVHDLALAQKPATAELVFKSVNEHTKVLNGPEKVKLGGLDAEAYEFEKFGTICYVRVTTSGKKVYHVRVSRGNGFGDSQVGDREFSVKAKKFFESFRFGDGAITDTAPKPGTGTETPTGSPGEFTELARGNVKPFFCAGFAATKDELITIGVRETGPNTSGGVLRRYSLPAFKLVATYNLKQPAHLMAIDANGGRLYLASAKTTGGAKAFTERESAILQADIQAFDLLKITGGTLADAEELKPVQTFYVGSLVSGLEVSGNGASLFVSCVVPSGKAPNISYRGKLMKCDTITGKWQADIASDLPIWALDKVGDGKVLVAIEGNPQKDAKNGNLVLVDAANWKRQKSTPLSGAAWDLSNSGDRTAAIVPSTGTSSAVIWSNNEDASEVKLEAEAAYIRLLPDGKHLLASNGSGNSGVQLMRIEAGKPPKLVRIASAGEIGGNFIVSPDGKYAAFNAGIVLDLAKATTAKK